MSPILVIADDLSGAAELAGIAAARGLIAEVHREVREGLSTTADVLTIDTDTRNSSAERAAKDVLTAAGLLSLGSPARVYKKVDSVLRGHVRGEIEALLTAWSLPRAILIPANPSRGRKIVDGTYLIDGVALDQTLFGADPEFPRLTSRCDVLLDASGHEPIQMVRAQESLPRRGIIIPDAGSLDDLRRRAAETDNQTLPAGAADFFEAMLDHWCASPICENEATSSCIQLPALLVCGSRAACPARNDQCTAAKITVIEQSGRSATLANSASILVSASQVLQSERRLVLSCGQDNIPPLERVSRLQELAQSAALIVRQNKLATLLLEGGATAAAVVSQLCWNRFSVQRSNASGVGMLKPIGDDLAPVVLIKPGSYAWPAEIWRAFCG